MTPQSNDKNIRAARLDRPESLSDKMTATDLNKDSGKKHQ